MNISPLDKILLECIAHILEEKSTLVRIGLMFDNQFMKILSYSGFPMNATTVLNEINYLEEQEYIVRVEKSTTYVGKSVHYLITAKGLDAIQ